MGSNPARDKAKNKKEKGEKQHEYKHNIIMRS